MLIPNSHFKKCNSTTETDYMYSSWNTPLGEHSKMATTSPDNRAKELECPVCNNHFIMPKILPCGHLVCRHCIIFLISSKNELHCPVCRHTIIEQKMQNIKCPSAIADSLPTDIAMDALAMSVDVLGQKPECCVCDGVKADFICLQCRDLLCSLCINAHEKLSATRNHCVENLRTVSAERLAANGSAVCADHGEKLSFYCPNHNLAVCASCAIKEHKTCSEVKDLDMEMESAKDAMQVIAHTLTEGEITTKQIIRELDSCEQESLFCQKLCGSLIAICNKQKELTSPDSTLMEAVRDTKEKLYQRLGRIRSYKTIAYRARVVSLRPGLIHAKRALQERMNTQDLLTTRPADTNTEFLRRTTDCNELLRRIKSELRQLEQQRKKPEEQQMTFHRNRGYGVILGWNGVSAECQGHYGGVVVSSSAMETNFIFEIQVVEMKRDWQPDDIMFCGITGTHPNDLNIKQRICDMEDVKMCHQAINGLAMNVKQYDIIGLMIDPANNFHFFLNKLPLYIAKHIPRPCYVVFDLDINIKKIIALPAVRLTNVSWNWKGNQPENTSCVSTIDLTVDSP
ncbi:protein PML-like isoform X2 [Pomacea canaliculata]|uniref:protein PML-like isoform X2 n=1 Tax=Pomacea canaliculata TaxID=400727 RepID=UPI000D72F25C|nr:protein PML-like isoform X2 [Pomacea canaliculata]